MDNSQLSGDKNHYQNEGAPVFEDRKKVPQSSSKKRGRRSSKKNAQLDHQDDSVEDSFEALIRDDIRDDRRSGSPDIGDTSDQRLDGKLTESVVRSGSPDFDKLEHASDQRSGSKFTESVICDSTASEETLDETVETSVIAPQEEPWGSLIKFKEEPWQHKGSDLVRPDDRQTDSEEHRDLIANDKHPKLAGHSLKGGRSSVATEKDQSNNMETTESTFANPAGGLAPGSYKKEVHIEERVPAQQVGDQQQQQSTETFVREIRSDDNIELVQNVNRQDHNVSMQQPQDFIAGKRESVGNELRHIVGQDLRTSIPQDNLNYQPGTRQDAPMNPVPQNNMNQPPGMRQDAQPNFNPYGPQPQGNMQFGSRLARETFGQQFQQQTGPTYVRDSREGGNAQELRERRNFDYSGQQNNSFARSTDQSFNLSQQSFPSGMARRPDWSHQNRGPGELNSPMSEFDIDKRRNETSQVRARRSRPLSQHIRDLIYWRNVKDSGVIFSFGLILLLSLSYFSIISIFAYLSMITLILITSFVLIKQVTLAFQQQSSEHPFKALLDSDVVISPDYAHQQLDNVLKPMNKILFRIRNLYLADSLGQTLKLIFIMYILTYIGSWFNLLTLMTIVWVGAFTVPKFYETYKEQIDSVLHVIMEGFHDVRMQLTSFVRGQVNKVRPVARRPNVGGSSAGQIRPRGVKMGGDSFADSSGPESSYKFEQKIVEKVE